MRPHHVIFTDRTDLKTDSFTSVPKSDRSLCLDGMNILTDEWTTLKQCEDWLQVSCCLLEFDFNTLHTNAQEYMKKEFYKDLLND